MPPIIAIDLGAAPALVVVGGDEKEPRLAALALFASWDTNAVLCEIDTAMQDWGCRDVYVERTFTWRKKTRRYLLDTGRKQEAQAGFLAGWLWGRGELHRVEPVSEAEAFAAWCVFGKPDAGKGAKGEHIRDALGIALKALIRQNDRAAVAAEEA